MGISATVWSVKVPMHLPSLPYLVLFFSDCVEQAGSRRDTSCHFMHSTVDDQHISCSREPFCGSQTTCFFPFLVHCLVSTVVHAKCDLVLLWLNPGGSGGRGCCLTCWSFREQLLRLTSHRFDTLVSVMLQSILY